MKKVLLTVLFAVVIIGITGCGKKAEEAVKEGTERVTKAAEKAVQKVVKPDPMVLVQGGTFQMGSSDGEADEKPVHEVTVSDFYIGRYEVTEQAYYEVLVDHNRRLLQTLIEIEKNDFDKAKSLTNEYVKFNTQGELILVEVQKPKNPNYPKTSVSWFQAVEFCNWKSEKEGLQKAYTINGDKVTCDFTAKGYRLPTEAEWEYAARGGNKSEGYKYSGGSNYLKVAWMSENSGNKAHPVGTKEPNELGIYDMSGNVWEWCWDWYNENYYKNSPKENPKGTTNGSLRVLRGGNWYGFAYICRVSCRYNGTGSPYYSSYHGGGFRLAKTK